MTLTKTKYKKPEVSTVSNLTERLMFSVTPDERSKLESYAAQMTRDLGVPVSLSAAVRALLKTSLSKEV